MNNELFNTKKFPMWKDLELTRDLSKSEIEYVKSFG